MKSRTHIKRHFIRRCLFYLRCPDTAPIRVIIFNIIRVVMYQMTIFCSDR